MFKFLLAAAALTLGAAAAHADDSEKAVRDALHAVVPSATPDSVQKSELPGFYEIVIKGQVFFISNDGKYLVQGDVYNIPEKTSITSHAQASFRRELLKKLPQDKVLVFAPPKPKHTVTVFTDVDCPYCRQFHKQITAFNQAGIAVRYVLFPLSIHPGADKKAVAVWCSADRNAAYTAAMNGQDPGKLTCNNPVAETTAFGLKLGINATPTILSENGTQVNGNYASDPKLFLAELDKIEGTTTTAKTPVAAK